MNLKTQQVFFSGTRVNYKANNIGAIEDKLRKSQITKSVVGSLGEKIKNSWNKRSKSQGKPKVEEYLAEEMDTTKEIHLGDSIFVNKSVIVQQRSNRFENVDVKPRGSMSKKRRNSASMKSLFKQEDGEFEDVQMTMLQSIVKHTKFDGGDSSDGGYGEKLQALPTYNLDSKILNYKQFCSLWQQMPKYQQIRTPTKVFESLVHGYNIDTMYNNVYDFLCENGEGRYDNYHHCLIVIMTSQNDIFGALITASPIVEFKKSGFAGSYGSFVFTAHLEDEIIMYQ